MIAIGWTVLVGICLGLAAAAAARLMRGVLPSLPPARHHQALSALLVVALVTPIALQFVDVRRVGRALPAVASSHPGADAAGDARLGRSSDTSSIAVMSLAAPSSLSTTLSPYVRGLGALWAAVTLFMTLRLVGGLWYTARLRYAARPADRDLVDRVERLATRAVTTVPTVLLSNAVDVPVTMGWWRPAIVVPDGLSHQLSSRDLNLVLAHELAHVRRDDYASGLVHAAIGAIAALSPGHLRLVALARRVREEACDDLAIGIAGDAGEFGAMLGRLAGLAHRKAMTGLACSAVWNVADRIRRLSPSFAPSRLDASQTAMTIVVLLACLAMTSEGAALARQASTEPVTHQSAPDLEVQRSLATQGILSSYMFHQPNSPVRLDAVLPSRSYVFDTVVLHNVFAKQITAVMFNAIIERVPAAVMIVSSPSLRLSLQPGQRAEVAAHFMTIDEATQLKVDGKVQPMLTVARIEFEDGTQWGAPIDISARSASDAVGIHAVTLPREFLSAALPSNSTTPETNCYGGYSEDEQFSPGAIVPIAGETARFARCIDGRWVEVDPHAMTLEHGIDDMRRNGVVVPIERKVTLRLSNSSLADIAAELSRQTGVRIAIQPDVPQLRGLTLEVNDAQLLAALQILVGGHQLTYHVLDTHTIAIEPRKSERP